MCESCVVQITQGVVGVHFQQFDGILHAVSFVPKDSASLQIDNILTQDNVAECALSNAFYKNEILIQSFKNFQFCEKMKVYVENTFEF